MGAEDLKEVFPSNVTSLHLYRKKSTDLSEIKKLELTMDELRHRIAKYEYELSRVESRYLDLSAR